MKYIKSLAFIIFLYLSSLTSYAQTTKEDETLSLDKGSIENQFEYVIQKASSWNDEKGQAYKVMKRNWLYELKAHTLDSLKAIHKNLTDTQVIVANQAKEIADLKSGLTNTQNDLTKTVNEKNSMSFFGAQISKTGYNILMWFIIAGLLALLILFIYKFNNSNVITKDAKRSLSEMEDEYEEHRKTALAREQKVRRQLQDEINKQKAAKNNKLK